MLADRHLAARLERLRVVEKDLRPAPQRHVERRPVSRDEAGVGFRGKVHTPRHGARGQVEGGEALSEHVDHEEPVAGRSEREAPQEPLLDGLADRERVREFEMAGRPQEFPDRPVGAARGEEALAVGVPSEAEPRVGDRGLVQHGESLQVDDRQRRLRVAVVRDDGPAPVGRDQHGERQVPDHHVAPRRRDPPTVGQQRHALAGRSGQLGGDEGRRGGGENRRAEPEPPLHEKNAAYTHSQSLLCSLRHGAA